MTRRELGIVVATFLAQAVAIGATLGSFTLFARPVAAEFDAPTTAVMSGVALIVMMLGVSGIGVGLWLDRAPARRVMLTGAVILVTGLLLASRASSLGALAAACVFTGSGIPMLGPLTTAAVIGKAFDERRGRALGIANTGVNIGGLTFAAVAAFALEPLGWRSTLAVFAAIAGVVVVPAIFAGIPRDLGGRSKRPGAASDGVAPALDADPAWTPARLVRNASFWTLALAMGLAFGTVSGWSAHLAPFLQDRGATIALAGIVVGTAQGVAVLGAIGAGVLAERRGPTAVLVAVIATLVGFLALYLVSPDRNVAAAAAIGFGAVSGGAMPVYSLLLTQRFGPNAVGTALGLSNLCLLPFGIAMPVLGGVLHDRQGDYAGMIALCACALALGSVLIALSARGSARAS